MPSHEPEGHLPGQERARVAVRGVVQGVGFRPFLSRLASELGLAGWVLNNPGGVVAEIEGGRREVRQFILRLEKEAPPRSAIHNLEVLYLDLAGYKGFEIRASECDGETSAAISADIAMCPACLSEISDPGNRRYRYPFTNCTQCGPRYSIIDSMPYDRARTSMASFAMCSRCQAEYDDPCDRRFHAQPNACPKCGPHLELWDADGTVRARNDSALHGAVSALAAGKIVAVKGIGGFHLMALAGSRESILRLRTRKHREEKPFAIMVPSGESAIVYCDASPLEERLLRSPEAPIVLLRRKNGAPKGVCEVVAPSNPYLGVMLPYTPLHHLLMGDLDAPVVATSGNLADEPICTDEFEALERLGSIADLFLVHNRPIRRPVDDSIVQVVLGRPMVLRRARGFAPLPVILPRPVARIFAAGAHQKSTIAIAEGRNVFLSQHLGDLEAESAVAAYQNASRDLPSLLGLGWKSTRPPAATACDLHPDYLSTSFARSTGLPLIQVQHHYAHALACMADNELEAPCLAVCWDGTGLGTDGAAWGGEFLHITECGFERLLCLRPFHLPGGDAAAREPRRCAMGVLFEIFREKAFAMALPSVQAFDSTQRSAMERMLARGIHAPVTTSAGRLFDAVASLIGLSQRTRFEGQAAMALEFQALDVDDAGHYPFEIRATANAARFVDWEAAIRSVLADIDDSVPLAVIAARFHNTLAEMIVTAACFAGLPRVVLSGGCFQNRRLVESAARRLQAKGFKAYWHQRVPPNDGGIALGQVIAAARHRH